MKNNDFSSKQRLLKTWQFKRLFQARLRLMSPYFVLLARSNEQVFPRLGIVVAKKQVKKAVKRNWVKRLVRESFRQHKCLLPEKDIVIIARRPVLEASNDQVSIELERLWKKLGRSPKSVSF